jgi:hypothetical protein
MPRTAQQPVCISGRKVHAVRPYPFPVDCLWAASFPGVLESNSKEGRRNFEMEFAQNVE